MAARPEPLFGIRKTIRKRPGAQAPSPVHLPLAPPPPSPPPEPPAVPTPQTPRAKRPKKRRANIVSALLDAVPRSLIQNNRNWLCVLCGSPGTGKSFTALRLAEAIDPTFNARRVVFTAQEFLEIFPYTKPGQVIVFDEGEEVNARRSMSEKNVQFGIILSMIRFTQVSVIFTLPNIQMIDINTRRLMHSYLHTIPVNRITGPKWKRTRSGVFWYQVETSRLPTAKDDLKFIFPVVHGVKIRKVWFNAPSPDLVATYEARKREHFEASLQTALYNVINGPAKKKGGGSHPVSSEHVVPPTQTAPPPRPRPRPPHAPRPPATEAAQPRPPSRRSRQPRPPRATIPPDEAQRRARLEAQFHGIEPPRF